MVMNARQVFEEIINSVFSAVNDERIKENLERMPYSLSTVRLMHGMCTGSCGGKKKCDLGPLGITEIVVITIKCTLFYKAQEVYT